jgi:hypothetical protein
MTPAVSGKKSGETRSHGHQIRHPIGHQNHHQDRFVTHLDRFVTHQLIFSAHL